VSDSDSEKTDLKIQIVEQRLEIKLVSIDAKLDRLFEKMISIGEKSEEAKDAAKEAKTAAEGARAAAGNMKWNIAFAVLGTLAIIFAMWGIWAQGIEMLGGLLGGK